MEVSLLSPGNINICCVAMLRYIATPNIGGDIPIDVPTNQNIGGDTSPASPAGLTPMMLRNVSAAGSTMFGLFYRCQCKGHAQYRVHVSSELIIASVGVQTRM